MPPSSDVVDDDADVVADGAMDIDPDSSASGSSHLTTGLAYIWKEVTVIFP